MRNLTIGITMNYGAGDCTPRAYLDQPYIDWVRGAGAIAAPLPPSDRIEHVAAMLNGVDALLLSGGGDPDPSLWHEPLHPKATLIDPLREKAELLALDEALRRGMPVLGVCLGMQMINIHFGGSLHQHLPDLPGVFDHRGADGPIEHEVELEPTSKLGQWAQGQQTILVNSAHHQGVARVGDGLIVAARSSDGVCEAIEAKDKHLFLLGLQWHPERLADDRISQSIMTHFLKHCQI